MKLATDLGNTVLDTFAAAPDVGGAGFIEIRSGIQPSSPDESATGDLLATLDLSEPAFGAAANKAVAAAPISTTVATGTGTATWFRVYDGNGDAVEDGAVSTPIGDGELVFDSVEFSAGNDVSISSWTVEVS